VFSAHALGEHSRRVNTGTKDHKLVQKNADVVAHVIAFYIPARFKPKPKGVTDEQRGCVCDKQEEAQKSSVLNAKKSMPGRSLTWTLASTGGL
jgi:hypothetical protein